MYAKSSTTIANILTAAQNLFIDKNYADVTMSGIAGVAQVTKGALYHHFASKEELYQAMMLTDLAEKQRLMQSAAEYNGTCQERLHLLTLNFLRLPYEKRELMRLVRRDINIFRNPIRDALVRAYQAALPEQVEAIIKDGMRDQELSASDPRLLSWQYVAMVEVVLSQHALNILQNHTHMADYVLSLFFNGAGNHKNP